MKYHEFNYLSKNKIGNWDILEKKRILNINKTRIKKELTFKITKLRINTKSLSYTNTYFFRISIKHICFLLLSIHLRVQI